MNHYHPTPQMMRYSFIDLNGIWHYAFDNYKNLLDQFDGEIVVPFSPETSRSLVNRQLMPDEYLHYMRLFDLNIKDNEKVLLHFGAVDQICDVYINHKFIGSHSGGYTSFTFDITDQIINGDNELYVIVKDVSDTSYYTRGKQKLHPGGMYYTAQSGIWQDVWMEIVPNDYIHSLKITPLFDTKQIKLDVEVNEINSVDIEVYESINDDLYGHKIDCQVIRNNDAFCVDLGNNTHLWTPDDPYLYGLKLIYNDDIVYSYFAMRKWSCDQHMFYLNNQPIFFNGVLDQGYWIESLMTPPNDDAMIKDIMTMKNCGFNTLRKHVKIEPMRWYYHCDRLGMIVWQDMINGGESYNDYFLTYRPNIFLWTQRHTNDAHKKLNRVAIEGKQSFLDELTEMINQLYNVPCIALWTPFNEGWGQFDTNRITKLIRELDDTRLIDSASGWYDQGDGDVYSIHNYFIPLFVRKHDRVVALTEYGGYTFAVQGHVMSNDVYGYKDNGTLKQLKNNYEKLIQKDILPNIKRGLCAAIYTQVSDIETEINGLMTYDREVLKMQQSFILEMNQKIYVTFNRSIKVSKDV